MCVCAPMERHVDQRSVFGVFCSDVEKYLPQERRSAAFKVSRVGLPREQPPLQRLDRLEGDQKMKASKFSSPYQTNAFAIS